MKVLIIDDEEHVRDAIEVIVDWDKYNITHRYMAGSVDDALAIIDEHNPEIIFCDIKMPEKTGLELVDFIRKEGLEVQVIIVSGYDNFEFMRASIQAKAVDYILKPIKRKEVEAALEQAIKSWKENAKTNDWRELIELTNGEKEEKQEVIHQIKEYLDSHFKEKITLERLGKVFFLTPQYISSKFKETYGITIIDYVTLLKIKKAKILLSESNLTVSSIAYDLGFSNENYFSKVFKKYEGKSPKNFREDLK
jgi:two-component system, response regulator YesN